MNFSAAGGLAVALLLLPAAAPAGDPQRGEVLFDICSACHGPDAAGIPALQAPRIAGLDSDYIVRQLQDFRAGLRGHPEAPYGSQMRAIASSLADDQAVLDVAAYVATLPPPDPPAPVDGDVARGQRTYVLCSACHGEHGEGSETLHSPRLADQSDRYLADQLRAFRAGWRGTHGDDVYGVQMRVMALTLENESAIDDVVAYIATLQAPMPQPTVEGDLQQGGTIYALCAACHGERGEGNPTLQAPRLAGQSDWYLAQQLQAFRSGFRGYDAEDPHGEQMRRIALTLADDDAIRDVTAYIATLGTD